MLAIRIFLLTRRWQEGERAPAKAATVLEEILDMPDGLSAELLDKAECVVVLPSVKKFALGIGGKYGRGAMVCREGKDFQGPWGPPVMMALEGGNIGFQIGGQATDFLLLVMNEKGANSVLKSKVKLGADASAAAGPKGRTAEASTDAYMTAEYPLLPFTGTLRRGLIGRLDTPTR